MRASVGILLVKKRKETSVVSEIDYLARDVLAAQKAGMSYGNWKAIHLNTREKGENLIHEDESEINESAPVDVIISCVVCGTVFHAKSTRAKFCCDACRKLHKAKQAKLRTEVRGLRKRARQKVMENEHT